MKFEIIDKKSGQFLLSPDIDKNTLKKLSKHSNLNSIQFSEPVTDVNVWINFRDLLFSKNPDIELYIYSNYNKPWDLSFLKLFPNLKTFGVGGYMDCLNIDSIGNLGALKSLSINSYKFENFDFLNKVNPNLISLILGSTKTKKIDIYSISRFQNLENLSVWGHKRGIDQVSKLSALKNLHLSVNLENLDFISQLDKLKSVKLSFSQIKNLGALTQLKSLTHLDILQVRKLVSLEFISGLKNLKNLILTNLPNVETFPELSYNNQLELIDIENLKGLKHLESLEFAESLKEFSFVNCGHLQPEDFLPVLRNKNIQNVNVGFGSDKKNNKFEDLKLIYGFK